MIANKKTTVQRKLADPPGLRVMKKRERFTYADMQAILDRVNRYGFANCRLTLSVYYDQPYRLYRDIPGQALRLRVFNVKALGELLKKIDEVAEEAEING